MACPESADDRGRGFARDRPDLSFRAAARVRGAADARDDPDGGRRRVKRWLFRHFMDVAKRWGEKIANGEPVPIERAARIMRSAIS
jgi:long-chain acyl-CoA synthetase